MPPTPPPPFQNIQQMGDWLAADVSGRRGCGERCIHSRVTHCYGTRAERAVPQWKINAGGHWANTQGKSACVSAVVSVDTKWAGRWLQMLSNSSESNVQNTPVGNTLAVVQSGIFFFLQTGWYIFLWGTYHPLCSLPTRSFWNALRGLEKSSALVPSYGISVPRTMLKWGVALPLDRPKARHAHLRY